MRRAVPLMVLMMVAPVVAQPAPVAPANTVPVPAPAPPGPPAPAGFQFLYGSGEGAAVYRSVWQAMVRYVEGARRRPHSVVALPGYVERLATDPNAAAPNPADGGNWASCRGKPFAVVLDMDETVLLNSGFEYDAAMGTPYSDKRWRAWEVYSAGKVMATPGSVEALRALRAMKVTVIFNSNRLAADAAQNVEALRTAGLLEGGNERLAHYVPDDAPEAEKASQTLYLANSPDPADTAKDGRRNAIAAHWCVLAMGGDQLGDFTDGFGTSAFPPAAGPLPRRAFADRFAALWGAGWFAFPNPAYGSALKGSAAQIFEGREWPVAPSSGSK